jgi:FKBP-type peptidyl-prolyl cis-trans isomerase
MRLRGFVSCVLIVGCTKAEPTPSSQAESPPKAVAIEAHVAPEPKRTLPQLPEYSDANPPGVPRLTGAIQHDRGLPYIDEVVGNGRSPEKGQTVKVHYTGWLTDGTKFDSTYDRDQPMSLKFEVGQVIKGWDLGLASMRVGGKRRLIIPAELGYGERGASDVIPPDSTLVFDVELIDVLD